MNWIKITEENLPPFGEQILLHFKAKARRMPNYKEQDWFMCGFVWNDSDYGIVVAEDEGYIEITSFDAYCLIDYND